MVISTIITITMTITNNIITIPITNDIKTKTILTDLAGGGHTGVQAAGCPAPVPGTGGDCQVVLQPVTTLEVPVRATGVEDLIVSIMYLHEM